jgi:hypothetical protein
MNRHRYVGFAESLDDNDYGVIITKTGRIKGVWIPNVREDQPIPQSVVHFCVANFGIDPNNDDYVSQTVH